MKKFYFVRHGQTDANLQGLMCGGGWDLELNSNGVAQAQQAAELLKHSLDEVSSIFVSPMRRARKTAEIIANEVHAHKITTHPDLKEWDIGSWDRKPFVEVKEEFLGSGEPGTGESRAEFGARAQRALAHCLAHDGPVLIVSHGGIWLAFQHFLGLPMTKVENCVPHRVFQDGDAKWKIEKI